MRRPLCSSLPRPACLQKMIDLHAHILPGMDDGAPSLEASLEMARLAVESGVKAMAATPHCGLPDGDGPDAGQVRTAAARLGRALERAGIPLRLYAGMEIFGTAQTAQRLREGTLIPLAGSRYPLIEFPFEGYARQATQILEAVLRLGMQPIVAHPERYRYAQADPQLLNEWVDMGCLLQINRGSLLGRFGPREETLAHRLVGRGFAAFVASDAHTPVVRTPWLRDVWALLCREYSEETARLLLEENPARVLGNRAMDMDEPEWFD